TELLGAPSPLDRTEYHLLDLAGQEVFSIDATGAVTQKIYDANGNCIQIIQYAQPLDLSSLPAITVQSVQAAMNPQDTNNRVTYRVHDEVDRLVFIIDPE